MFHLNVRVAWHDNRWNGSVCNDPLLNSYCLDLERIRSSRLDAHEVKFKGKLFADIAPADLPPCKAESGAFMNEHQWMRNVEHPYASNKKAQATHGHLLSTNIVGADRKLTHSSRHTNIPVSPYSTFAVPFYWMLRGNQEELQSQLPNPLPVGRQSSCERRRSFATGGRQLLRLA